MADGKPYELSLELGQGDCRILVDGLALNIRLTPPREGMPAPAALAAPPALPLPQLPQVNGESGKLMEELQYYRQISEDIYTELGQLAKKLNLSLKDLTIAEVLNSQIDSPGEQIDHVRVQLNDVLEMTEKATLNILDLVEQIREDCEAMRQEIVSLGPGAESWEEAPALPAAPQATIWSEETKAFLAQLVEQGQELNLQLQAVTVTDVPAAEPPAAPAAPSPGLHFPLGEILQIVLEFCGNEALKQHLKAVITKQGEIFRTQEVEAAFAQLGASLPVDDGFTNFPVEETLKILHGHCTDKRFQELFTKILGSAGKLFPMPELPLEGHPVEAAPAPAPAHAPAAAPAPQPPGFLPLWEDFFQKIQDLAAQAQSAPEVPARAEGNSLEEAKIQETTKVLDRITASLSRIMEALAFQDLTGQRLLQVLKILRSLQFQILTMVVSAGTKLKKKAEQQGITLEESGMMAQGEIDRLLSNLAPPSSPSGTDVECAVDGRVLDQEAVNDLLTSMGF
jgi:chemotaxis regulatin CheY-phosphate phosphatase CheZ